MEEGTQVTSSETKNKDATFAYPKAARLASMAALFFRTVVMPEGNLCGRAG